MRRYCAYGLLLTPLLPVYRRQFLAQSLGTAAALSLRAWAQIPSPAPARWPIIGFTKPFQKIGYERTAEVVAEIGWSGIECPVRKGGQVEPEQVEDELPKLNAALARRGLNIGQITTTIVRPDALTERVLRAARKLGVRHYRLGYFHYDLRKPIRAQVAEVKASLRDLAQLNAEIGIQGGFQNHSGPNYVGAAVWDLAEVVQDYFPELGACFDIGHATVEGGSSWPIEAQLIEPLLSAVYVKDFLWVKEPKGWAVKWAPLGSGMVSKKFFDWLKTTSFSGPISQHVEYLEGAGPEEIQAMRADCALLKRWLAA